MKIRCNKSVIPVVDGKDAIYPYLSTGAILLIDGLGYTDAVTTFRMYDSNVEVDLTSETIVVESSNSAITYSWSSDGLGKKLTITYVPANTIQEQLILKYTYGGNIYEKIVNIAKIKKGGDGSQLIFADKTNYTLNSGVYIPYSHLVTGITPSVGDVFKCSMTLTSYAQLNRSISFLMDLTSYPVPLSFSTTNTWNITVEMYMNVVSYSAGNLYYTSNMIVRYGRLESGSSDNIILDGIGVHQFGTASGGIKFGVATIDVGSVQLNDFKIEYKKNYNKPLQTW